MAGVGEEIKRLREGLNMSQPQVAVKAGVAVSAVSQIENGRRSPNVGTLEKIAGALGVEVVDLFPKAQAPLPFEDARRRGSREAREVLAAAGPWYSAYEGQGRILATRWEEDLREWEEKIPAGSVPDLFDAGRLIQWAMDIVRDRGIYEAMVRETDYMQRNETIDTLKLLEDAEQAALRMVRRVIDPAKTYAKFRKIWEANDMEAVLSNAENDV